MCIYHHISCSSLVNKEVIVLEKLIEKYGEEYRSLIEDAWGWLDLMEDRWHLETPINRLPFIEDLVSRMEDRRHLKTTRTLNKESSCE